MSKDDQILQGNVGKDQTLEQNWDLWRATNEGQRARFDVAAMARGEAMKLSERLFLVKQTDSPRTVIFSSVDPGDGSSTICARVGEALAARISESVCLVDANLYSPSLHRQFDVESSCGLEEMVREPGPIQTYARQMSTRNLWLVTAGRRRADPHTVLASNRMRERMAELRREFAYVLIEAPAISINGTATLLGPLADGVVLVVEANLTRREVARNAKESLERANVRLLGAVLNNRTFPIPDLIYRSI